MNDTLKAAGRIGAELGAAKAELERLRELLRDVEFRGLLTGWEPGLIGQITAALSQRPDPTDTYTAVDMATAAAQGFRDGQAAVEQSPAQDEREAVERFSPTTSVPHCGRASEVEAYMTEDDDGEYMAVSQHERIVAALTRPAQTEQQPFMHINPQAASMVEGGLKEISGGLTWSREALGAWTFPLYAAPIAQAAPLKPHQLRELVNDLRDVARKYHATEQLREQIAYTLRTALSAQGAGKFAMRQRVRKTSGSEWQGRICGTYSTALTPEGYAVESEAHAGSVQIYPAKALEAVE